MKRWADDFLGQCLSAIPSRAYRKRLEQELTDHLNELAADLEAGGRSSQEARAEALKRMGDPAKLARSYQDEWKNRSLCPRYYLPKLLEGTLQTWIACTLCRIIITVLTFHSDGIHDLIYEGLFLPLSSFMPGGLALTLIYSVVAFLPGMIHGTRDLERAFVDHPNRNHMVGAGMLLSWTAEKFAFDFVAALEFISQVNTPTWEEFISVVPADSKIPITTLEALYQESYIPLSDVIPAFHNTYPYYTPIYFAVTLALTVMIFGLSVRSAQTKSLNSQAIQSLK